jgi:hypothetical protein
MTEPCQQEERIKHIEAKVDVITDKIEEIRPDIMLIKDRLVSTVETVEEHERALRGSNGDIGALARVLDNAVVLRDLIITLRGEGQNPGLIGAISRLTEKMSAQEDDRRWLSRLVIGWLITSLVGGAIMVYVMEGVVRSIK